MKKIFLLCAIFLSQSLYALPNSTQVNSALNSLCQKGNITYQNKSTILNLDSDNQNQVFFIKNNSSQSIWLDHPGKAGTANAGWSSYLRPGNWSALYVTQKSFELTCSMIEPGKVNYIPCEQSLSICTSTQINYPSKRKGSYWIAEDKSWKEIIKGTMKRGFKLP